MKKGALLLFGIFVFSLLNIGESYSDIMNSKTSYFEYYNYKFKNGSIFLVRNYTLEQVIEKKKEPILIEEIEREDDVLSISAVVECSNIPSDSCKITQDTIFEQGIYNLPNGMYIAKNNIILDCNNSMLIGNKIEDTIGLRLWNYQNVTIKNCVIKNYSEAISLGGAKNNTIKSNQIESNNVGIRLSSVYVSINEGPYEEVSSDYNIIEKNMILFNNKGMDIFRWENLTSNLIQNNDIFYNNKGIDLSYKEEINFSNNFLKGNKVCYSNIEDISIGCQPKGIIGEDNACDTYLAPIEGNLTSPLKWNWNDLGTKGCSYTCDNLICGKATPGIDKGFTLINWSFNGNDWNMLTMLNDWLKSSKESFYANLLFNLTYDFEAIFELNISEEVKEIRIPYSIYFLKEDNSISFSNEAFIYNFIAGEWIKMNSFLYLNGNFSLKRNIVNFPINNNFINNNKIRIKFEQKNIDDKPDNNLCLRDPFGHCGVNPEDCFILKLNSFTYQYCVPESFYPFFSNLPDKNISQDSKPDAMWIDLWDYVFDEDTPKENLTFSIERQSNENLINCWVNVKGYITCNMPTKGQSGFSDVTVKVIDPQGFSDTDTFRINVFQPSLTILFLPFDWSGSYKNYSEKADELASYFLERIPLSNCPEQFKLVKVKENENYGRFWDGWKCNVSGTHNLSNIHCFFGKKALGRIDDCGEQYKIFKIEEHDYIFVGISDNDISMMDDSSCKGLSGWSGDLPSIITETRTLRTATHELGHQFGLQDQYCDCSGTSYGRTCGPSASKSPLNITLGCDYNKDCCWNASSSYYPYDPSCRWCNGNFDRFGEDTDNDQILDKENRTLMGGSPSNHFDINEYKHLSNLSELQCRSMPLQSILSTSVSTNQPQSESNFNLKIILNVDKNDGVEFISLNFTNSKSFLRESEGEYSLKILDQSDNILYQKNFSLNFIIFSDPPIITNESTIFDIVKYQENMEKLEVYHNNVLIFSSNIPSFCNKNTICEAGENYLTCSDCKSNDRDGICNREKGDGCDFDCIDGVDSDCVDLSIINASLEENLTEGKQTKVKLSIGNLGIRSATFGIGLFSNSILEKNISTDIFENFSTTIEFNWTPQKACLKDLFFLLDFLNIINEINETNNELKIENVFINLQGDVDLSQKIDIFDLAKIGLCYAQTPTSNCANADLNNDGKIDIFDLASVGLNFGKTC